MAQLEGLLDGWLEDMTPRLTEQIYTEINFANGQLVYTTADLDISTKVISSFTADVRGETDYDDELSDEIPESSIVIGKDEFKTWHLRQGFTLKHEQVLAYNSVRAKSTTPMAEMFLRKPAEVALQVIMRKANPLKAYGRNSTTGLLNDPNLPTDPVTTALYQNAVTSQDLYDFMQNQIELIISNNSIEDDMANTPNIILLPLGLRKKMKRSVISTTGTQLSVERALLEDYPMIEKLHYTAFCSSATLEKYRVQAAGTNRDRILIYRRGDDRFCSSRMSPVVNYPSSYSKGAYWSGYVQSFSQVMWHNPMFSRLITFPNTP